MEVRLAYVHVVAGQRSVAVVEVELVLVQVVMWGQTVEEVLDFVDAAGELVGLIELAAEAETDLKVLEDGEGGADFGVGVGVGVALDAAEAVHNLLVVEAGADFGVAS